MFQKIKSKEKIREEEVLANKRRGSSSKYIFADQEEGNGSNIYKQKNKTKTTF